MGCPRWGCSRRPVNVDDRAVVQSQPLHNQLELTGKTFPVVVRGRDAVGIGGACDRGVGDLDVGAEGCCSPRMHQRDAPDGGAVGLVEDAGLDAAELAQFCVAEQRKRGVMLVDWLRRVEQSSSTWVPPGHATNRRRRCVHLVQRGVRLRVSVDVADQHHRSAACTTLRVRDRRSGSAFTNAHPARFRQRLDGWSTRGPGRENGNTVTGTCSTG